MESINNSDELINYYDFNEDCSCISIALKNSFKIILCEPYDAHYECNKFKGIGIIEMYKSTNILALTGLEKNSNFPDNKLIIWDDNKKEIIRELRLISKIRIVKIIKDVLFLVNDIKIYVFNFLTFELYNSFEIYSYKKELISFSVNSNIKIAYLKNSKTIYIKHIKFNSKSKVKILSCSNNDEIPFIYIQFNTKGDILAAATKNNIHLYNTLNGEFIKDIHNENLDFSKLNCIKFNNNDKHLAISFLEKNDGYIYIFDKEIQDKKGFLDYFFNEDDQYLAYYNLKCGEFIFCFDLNDNIIIITNKGEFFKISFNPKKGGICKLEKTKKILII